MSCADALTEAHAEIARLTARLQAISLDWQVKEMDAARYKWLRRQNVAEFKRLFVENIETGREFDDLVDELRMKRK